jgi:acyl transferase domain-containing protein
MADELRDDHIAIVGMSCRFPGAANADQYWRNLAAGVESILPLSDEDLIRSGVASEVFNHPRYVRSAALVDDMEGFDARLFGYTPREAEVRDPQGRMFLEACYAAIEDSGHDPSTIDGLVGVFGGMANNLYGERHVARNRAAKAAVGEMAIEVSNNSDYLTTTVSYRLGLRGPSVNVQTACSTALVAVHLASQALRHGECDYALAGGVEVELPYRSGYMWVEGSIYTRNGQIRAFDADASGTLFGSGVGVVVLKRLGDARADGDHVYAIIRGSAVNNDGGDRAGFTAPGVEGQAQLITEALAVAEVHPDTIGFVEAHATGTLVGDPIEVAGLTRAFRGAGASGRQACPIGSAKANIGHLGPAAGMAGLIKVCLAMREEAIPPNINFTTPNPSLQLEDSPFYVATELVPWPKGDRPRRAGVSSFGIGGTNAHLILEEAPPADAPPADGRKWRLLPFSAKTTTAAETAGLRLADHLADRRELDLVDVAYTLQAGRPALPHRRAVVASSTTDAVAALRAPNSAHTLRSAAPALPHRVVMMFPGQGSQHVGMGQDLYRTEPVFRDAVDRCADQLRGHLDVDLCELLYPHAGGDAAAEDRLRETRHAQPALFAVSYATAQLLASWGVTPAAMVGHSVGELVAAHLAGVFSLEDALTVVAARGRLMHEMAPGTMLAAGGPEELVRSLLPDGVEVAAVNSPVLTVVTGTPDGIARARSRFNERGVATTDVRTSHAFHSALMEPCLPAFRDVVAGVTRHFPAISFVSNLTGAWITAHEAVDPEYWAAHLRGTVRFAAGLTTVTADDDVVLLETGPGDVLTKLARQCVAHNAVPVVSTMRHPDRPAEDDRVFAEAVAGLWVAGGAVDWERLYPGGRRRTPLPPYPFERRRFWVDPDPDQADAGTPRDEPGGADVPLPVERCGFTSLWREEPLVRPAHADPASHWLVMGTDHPVVEELAATLAADGALVTRATPGPGFEEVGGGRFAIRAADSGDLDRLLDAASARRTVTDVVHAFQVDAPAADPVARATVGHGTETGFFSLLHLGQQLSLRGGTPPRLTVLTSNLQEVTGDEQLEPVKALVLGPVKVLQRELAGATCRSVDIALPATLPAAAVARNLVGDLVAPSSVQQVAWRGRRRWVLDYRTAPLDPLDAPSRPDSAGLRPGGTYLITGGLGGIGLAVATDLARTVHANLVLVGRSPLPPRAAWSTLAADPATEPSLRRKLHRLLDIESTGGTVLTVAADVANEEAVTEVVAAARARFGRLDGVFHSAGIAGGGMIALRGDADASRVLSSKVDGTLNLFRAVGSDVDFLALFSSIVAVTGDFGLVDYCAANNFIDAFARWAAQRGAPVVSIGWGGWSEFGMAADTDAAAPAAFRQLQVGSRSEPAHHPLLDRRVHEPGTDIVYMTRLQPGSHWISAEHQLGGTDLVVGTAFVEMAQAAYTEGVEGADGPCEVTDLIFLGPVGVSGSADIRTVLRPDDDGWSVTVSSADAGDSTPRWTERMRCRIRAVEREPAPMHDLAAIRRRCSRFDLSDAELGAADRLLQFGPRWRSLKSTSVGVGEELSRLELDERFRAECGRYRLHPALLDQAIGDAQYMPGILARGDTYLPFGYTRLRFHEPLPPRFWSLVTHHDDQTGEVTTVSVTLMHDDGQEIGQLTGYAMRRVDPAAMRAAVSAPRGEAEPAGAESLHLTAAGITEDLGIEVLRRIVRWRPEPHVIVCPDGLHRSLRRVESVTVELVEQELDTAFLGDTAAGERLVDVAYAAPEDDLQRLLASFWSGVLGMSEIGVDDDFFELGGNSLVAVQLAARMREQLSVELPIASLFDHPTIRSIAAHLTAERGLDGAAR